MKPAAIVEKAQEICEKYRDQGLTLTVRQLYYQFVSLGLLPNGQAVYKRIVHALARARVEGRFPMDLLEDRGRDAQAGNATRRDDDVDLALRQCGEHANVFGRQYLSYDRWFGQPIYLAIWVEKDALAGVFEQALQGLGVGLFACRGYPSVSALYQYLQNVIAATGGETNSKRFRRFYDDLGAYTEEHEGKAERSVVLYFGDHDPDGLQIPISAEETCREICENHEECNVILERDVFPTFKRIALNVDQINRYKPPPFPAKETSSRYDAYVRKTGLREAWELDALEPSVLQRLIREEVEEHFDEGVFKEMQKNIAACRIDLKEKMLKDGWLAKALRKT